MVNAGLNLQVVVQVNNLILGFFFLRVKLESRFLPAFAKLWIGLELIRG
jgi:hypothetical protein